jgi:hypothetical protein
MKKYIENLEEKVSSVLNESLVADAAELVGIEEEDAEERIKGLSFANYIELGNAIDLEDAETVREILSTVAPIEEGTVDEETLLDKPTPTLNDLVKKHGVSLHDLGVQLAKGIKVEKEHTSDMLVAKEIALDHLNELPDYYDRLEQVEETSGAGGTGAGAVSVGAVGGDIGTWDGKAHKKPKKGLKNAGKGIYEDSSDTLYHVTHTKYIPQITKNGLRPMGAPSNWVQQGSGDRYGMGEIYVFTNYEDAKKWAGRMDWDFNQTIGSGEISIITLRYPEGQDFEKDEADPMSQAGKQGDWLKTYEPIEPENIVDVQMFKSMNEADNPYAATPAQPTPQATPPSTAASSIDALAQPTDTAQETDRESNQRKDVDDLTVGDPIEVIDIDGDPTAVKVKNPRGPGETLIVQTDKGEEHIVKKQAVSGTPTIQEMYEAAMSRDDMLKHPYQSLNQSYLINVELPLVDGGTTVVPVNAIKRNPDGDYVIQVTTKTPSEGTYSLGAYYASDHPGAKYYSQGKEISVDDAYEIDSQRGEEKRYESALTDRVHEAYNANKTEHSGAKKGKGGYHGRKQDAKRDSNKKRRANDKKAISEVAPPGMEDWIKKRKPEFKDRYGKDWEKVLYATAWKRHNNESIEENKDEFKKKLVHGDRYFVRREYHIGKKPYDDFEAQVLAVSDTEDTWSGFKHKVRFKDNKGEEIVAWYPEPGKGGLSGRFYDEQLVKAGEKGKYVAGDSRNEWPAVGIDEKFDHYGSDARFIPVEFMGKEVGVVWQEGEGDWHAEVSATGASWGMIDSYKDAVKLVQDEAAELVNEGFDPATHVNVEHRDPDGKFIIVHAAPAGYWAVGKGQYQHDIDRTAFDNFDDALDHAHQCLASLDEGFDLSEILRLAGVVTESKYGVYRKSKQQLDAPSGNTSSESAKVKRGGKHVIFKNKKEADDWVKNNSKGEELFVRKVSKPVNETASAGATGAGAVATAPTAMGGMVRRSPSIYDKPKPKKRTKESSDDGIGRAKKK